MGLPDRSPNRPPSPRRVLKCAGEQWRNAGNPLPVGVRRSHAWTLAGARSGGSGVALEALEALSDPDLDDGLPGDAEAGRFPVQGLDHP